MSGVKTTSRSVPARSGHRRLPLSRRWRRAILVAHIVAAGTWTGIDVIVAVLVLTGRFGGEVAVRSLAYQALAAFVVWPMLTAGLVCLATGLILGMSTTWGLLRYWWVTVKLALNLVLCLLIVLVLQPGMDEVAGYGQDPAHRPPGSRDRVHPVLPARGVPDRAHLGHRARCLQTVGPDPVWALGREPAMTAAVPAAGHSDSPRTYLSAIRPGTGVAWPPVH